MTNICIRRSRQETRDIWSRLQLRWCNQPSDHYYVHCTHNKFNLTVMITILVFFLTPWRALLSGKSTYQMYFIKNNHLQKEVQTLELVSMEMYTLRKVPREMGMSCHSACLFQCQSLGVGPDQISLDSEKVSNWVKPKWTSPVILICGWSELNKSDWLLSTQRILLQLFTLRRVILGMISEEP